VKFAHFFIDRPVFAAVLSIVIVMLGGLALLALPVAQYPEIVPPTVVVRAVYPGANAEVVAQSVSTPIEQEVNGVEGMLYMSSLATSDGVMQLTITFRLGTDLDEAQVLVQNRVAIALPRLPEEVRRLGVTTTKQSPDLSLVVHLRSPDASLDQLYISNYALLQVKDVLARVPGVGNVNVFGAREYSMRVWIDPDLAAARGLTAGDIVGAIREQNIQVAAGAIGQPPMPKGTAFQYTATTRGRLADESEFAEIVVRSDEGGRVTRLKDVARVELGSRDFGISGLDGKPAVGMGIFQLPGTNSLETSAAIRATMERLGKSFPKGLEWTIVYDTTMFVRESVTAVVTTLFEAIGLVVIVVLVFLKTWRASLIPLLAVPVSLIGTLAAMQAFGFSLNNLSLFGLVLAIGIVVDDAIVVVENVERNLEDGLSPREATRKAMDEVSGAVVAIALVLAAVFVPTAFISGISGQFYRQFALTIAVSTLISAFNSLTLSPALAALLLRKHDAPKDVATRVLDRVLGPLFRAFDWAFDRGSGVYARSVGGILRHRGLALVVYAALLGLTYTIFERTPRGFIPTQDQGYLIAFAQLPDAASLERTEAVVREVARVAREVPGVGHSVELPGFSIISGAASNAGMIFLPLQPFEERMKGGRTAAAIQADLALRLPAIEEAFIAIFSPPPVRGLGATGGFRVMIQDRGGRGPDALQDAVRKFTAAASKDPALAGLFTTYRASVPQVRLDVDRGKAKAMAVPLGSLFETLQVYLGSLYVNDINLFGRTYQVTAQAEAEFRKDTESIRRLRTRSARGDLVPLGSLVDVRDASGPGVITRYNLFPAAAVDGGPAPGRGSSEARAAVERIAAAELPPGFGYEWTDLTFQQILAGDTAMYVFPLCVLFVFLTLAALYESWGLPLAIILIVPMCLLGGIIGVASRGLANDVFAQIGAVVLVGLACKNAILIVEFAKQKEDEGMETVAAAIEACRLRLRPIIMTSLAFVLGVVPLVIAKGAGAEMRRALGTTVFSGMIGVTVFGLLLTPVFYVLIRRMTARKAPSVAPVDAPAPVDHH